MRFLLMLVCLPLIASGIVSVAARAAEVESGFTSMFNGRNLAGWSATPPEAAVAWTAKDGMIEGNGDKGRCYLTYDKNDIANFEMKFSYRFPGKGNSGVNLRSVEDETGKRDFKAYHADIGHVGIGKNVLGAWDFHTPGRTEHRCFRGDRLVIDQNDQPTITPIENGLTLEDIHEHDWNDVHIVARGNQFKLFINGKLSSEFTEHLLPDRRLHKGMIQLQVHDPGMIVQFKDLRIKILDP